MPKFPGWCGDTEDDCITFSWEYETRNTKKVFKHYRPASIADGPWAALNYQQQLLYDKWLRHGRNAGKFSPVEDGNISQVLTQLGASQDAAVQHDPANVRNAPNPAKNFEFYRLMDDDTRGATLPPIPHQEVTESNCEMCHPRYLNDEDRLFDEIDWLYREFSVGGGIGGAKANFHVHMAFPVPPASGRNRDAIIKQLVGLTILVNNKGYFHTLSDIDKGMTQYASVLTSNVANSIEAFLRNPDSEKAQNKLGSFMDRDGAVCGLAKFVRVGFRYLPYNQLDGRNRATEVSRIGLEFRSGYALDEFKNLIRTAVAVIQRIGLRLGRNEVPASVQRCIDSYAALSSKVQMSHKHIPKSVKGFLKAVAMSMAHFTAGKQLPWAATRSTNNLRGLGYGDNGARAYRRGILDQWSFGFVPWEDHPLVPAGARAGLEQARRQLTADLTGVKAGTDWYGQKFGRDRKTTANTAQETQTTVNQVWRAIRTWKNTTNIEQYFSLHNGVAAAGPPAAAVVAAPVNHAAPAPPPPPPLP